MANSKSNVGTNLMLDISLISPNPDEEYKPYFSITSSNFFKEGKIDLIESWDQQLIYLEPVIDEYIKDSSNEDRLILAEGLEALVNKLKGKTSKTTCSCSACNKEIEDGAPWIEHENLLLCSGCYTNLIPKIFEMRGMGDGGIIDIIFQECVKLTHNIKYKKKFIPISKLGERIAKLFETK
jgi:hypothetical protein